MGKIVRVLGAYALATGATAAVGAGGAELARAFLPLPHLETWHTILALWLIVPGRLSLVWTKDYLAAQLGVKKPIEVQVAGIRHIPVNNPLARLMSWFTPAPAGALADEAQALGVWGMRSQPRQVTLDVGEGIILSREIRGEKIIVGEGTIIPFIRAGYNRQRAGEAHPFSRNYFVYSRPPKIEREYYDIIMETLQYHRLVIGRRQGAGGRLICEPRHVLTELRHYYHSPPR